MKTKSKFFSMLALSFFMGIAGSAGIAMADPVGSCTEQACCSESTCCSGSICRSCDTSPTWCAIVRNLQQ